MGELGKHLGIWNGITPRDGEATRRVATIERGVSRFLVSQDWEPFYPTQMYGVFASRWPLGEQAVYTIVNRNEYDVRGRQMTISSKPEVRYFDLYHGEEIIPIHEGGNDVLSFVTEAHGYGAILATPGEPDDLEELVDDVIGSINGIRNSTQKLRGCIVQSELPSFLRYSIALFMQRSIGLSRKQKGNGKARRQHSSKSRWWQMAHNPAYAGVYVFGRWEYAGDRGSAKTGKVLPHQVPMAQWPVKIDAHHPAYLSWEEYVKNGERLRQNWNREEAKGVARNGNAL